MNYFVNIKILVQIVTKKIAENKTNSIFYARKDKEIACVTIFGRDYVLRPMGEYRYSTKDGGKNCTEKSRCVLRMTDTDVRRIDREGLVSNWGWFGVSAWDVNASPIDNNEVYSNYDEAIKGFIAFVEKDITSHFIA